MRIFLGADHAGYELKEKLKAFLHEKGFAVEDFGAFSLNPEDDYPDFVRQAAEAVAKNPDENRGIVFGGSGQGEAIACNRFRGVRAAVYYGGSMNIIKLSREHNSTNVLSLGARFILEEEAKEAVALWLATPFGGGRHQRRIEKIDQGNG